MKKNHRLILWVSLLLVVLMSAPTFARFGTPGASANLTAGPPSQLIQISENTDPDCGRFFPRIAYNPVAHEYLAVWYNEWSASFRDIYARRISGRGELRTQFTVATGANGDGKMRFNSDIAAHLFDDEYLVVYMVDALGDDFHFEVWGRRVAYDGSWLGPEFKIFSWPHRAFWYPRVAFSSARSRYLVIADVLDTTTGKWNDVAGRLVGEDGSTPWAGRSISAQNQTLQPHRASLGYDWYTRSFLVVWRQFYSGEDWDIYGARVEDLYGTVVNPPGIFPIDRSASIQDFPVVAGQDRPAIPSDADRYLVVWQQGNSVPASNLDIYGRQLDKFGDPIGDRFPIASSPVNEDRPAVALHPDRRFVVWRTHVPGESYHIWKFDWNPFTEVIEWLASPVAANSHWSNPAIARGEDYAHMVVFGSPEGPPIHIYGALYLNTVYLPLIQR
jgi:hypothetical protein